MPLTNSTQTSSFQVAHTNLEAAARPRGLKRYLIVNEEGKLERTYFLNAWFEDIKGFFGIANLRDSRLIKLKALQLVASLGKEWKNIPSELVLIKSLAQQAGLLDDQEFQLDSVIETISHSIFEETEAADLINASFASALKEYKSNYATQLEDSFSEKILKIQEVRQRALSETAGSLQKGIETDDLQVPLQTKDDVRQVKVELLTPQKQRRWSNIKNIGMFAGKVVAGLGALIGAYYAYHALGTGGQHPVQSPSSDPASPSPSKDLLDPSPSPTPWAPSPPAPLTQHVVHPLRIPSEWREMSFPPGRQLSAYDQLSEVVVSSKSKHEQENTVEAEKPTGQGNESPTSNSGSGLQILGLACAAVAAGCFYFKETAKANLKLVSGSLKLVSDNFFAEPPRPPLPPFLYLREQAKEIIKSRKESLLASSQQYVPRLRQLKTIDSIANAINNYRIPIGCFDLTKEEMMNIAPSLKFLDCRNLFDGEGRYSNWTQKDIEDFLSQCTNLETLFINSIKITQLPALDKLQELDCSYCLNLTAIGSLKELRILTCRDCPDLELPELPQCKAVDCRPDWHVGHHNKFRLPQILPECVSLLAPFYGLRYPPKEVPKLQKIDENKISDRFFLIKLAELNNDPLTILNRLGKLLEGCNVPLIQVQTPQGFSPDPTYDKPRSGVEKLEDRRNFEMSRLICQLCQNLLGTTKERLLEYEGYVDVNLQKPMEGRLRFVETQSKIPYERISHHLPVFKQNESPQEQVESLKALGTIFAQCLSNKAFGTGQGFDPALFRAIASFSYEDLIDLDPLSLPDDLRLRLQATCFQDPWSVILTKSLEKLDKNDISDLQKLCGSEEDTQEIFDDIDRKRDLYNQARMYVITEWKKQDPVVAAAIIAKQMKISCGKTEWDQWRNQEVRELLAQIEGNYGEGGVYYIEPNLSIWIPTEKAQEKIAINTVIHVFPLLKRFFGDQMKSRNEVYQYYEAPIHRNINSNENEFDSRPWIIFTAIRYKTPIALLWASKKFMDNAVLMGEAFYNIFLHMEKVNTGMKEKEETKNFTPSSVSSSNAVVPFHEKPFVDDQIMPGVEVNEDFVLINEIRSLITKEFADFDEESANEQYIKSKKYLERKLDDDEFMHQVVRHLKELRKAENTE